MSGPQWDPEQYLRFEEHRSRPFHDLLARIEGDPATVVDLGSGAGNLTPVLRRRWPDAEVVGVDSSPQMVARARENDPHPRSAYVEQDLAVYRPDRPVDLVLSNAALQWVPAQREVLGRVTSYVAPGGSVAVQVPGNGASPSHTLLAELAEDPRFRDHLGLAQRLLETSPEEFLDILAAPGWEVDAWETTYAHVLPGEDPVYAWTTGTGARPYLQALPDGLREEFSEEYRARLREAYPTRAYGTVLPFRRVFAVARHVG